MDGRKSLGRIRYHYFEGGDNDDKCSDVLVLGVGTTMKVGDYDKQASSIATAAGLSSLVVVIADFNVGRITKISPEKFSKLSNAVRDQLDSLIPVCSGSVDANIFVGGHSASGQAVLQSIQKNLLDFTPKGFVGLSPFEVSKKSMDFNSPLKIPTLNWGFTRTTCFVFLKKAALGAYHLSSPEVGRVLYRIENKRNGITHCSFTNNGCDSIGPFGACTTRDKYNWVYDSVGKSIQLFMKALDDEGIPFNDESFEMATTASGAVQLLVNNDDIS